jgi:hypothetical protein
MHHERVQVMRPESLFLIFTIGGQALASSEWESSRSKWFAQRAPNRKEDITDESLKDETAV